MDTKIKFLDLGRTQHGLDFTSKTFFIILYTTYTSIGLHRALTLTWSRTLATNFNLLDLTNVLGSHIMIETCLDDRRFLNKMFKNEEWNDFNLFKDIKLSRPLFVDIVHSKKNTYFSRCTLCPIERRPFLGFAEVRVVRMTAPKLFTWVECAKLKPQKEENFFICTDLLSKTHE